MKTSNVKFEIEVEYQTGDSFGSYSESDTVGHIFNTAEEAIDAIDRIWEHKEAYDDCNGYGRRGKCKDYSKERWYTIDTEYTDRWQHSILLESGHKISAFWTGYFEELEALTIKVIR